MKCNMDGFFAESSNSIGCGGLLCKSTCEFSLAFAESLNWGMLLT